MPFMDVELARLVATFPDRFLSGHRQGKAVLRTHARAVLPPEIIDRKKVGFRVPVSVWFRDALRDVIRDLLQSTASETRRMLDGPAIDRIVGEHVSGRQNHEKVLWTLANLEMFLRSFRPSLAAVPLAAE